MYVLWNQSFRPFVVIAWGMVCGLVVADKQWIPWLLFIGICILSTLCGALIYYYFAQGLKITVFICAFASMGAFFTWADSNNVSQWGPEWEKQQSIFVGKVVSQPVLDGNRLTFDWQITAQYYEEKWRKTNSEVVKVRLRFARKKDQRWVRLIQKHQMLRSSATLQAPPHATNPGGFDYAAYLKHQHIHWLGEITNIHQLSIQQPSEFDVGALIDRLRRYSAQQIDQLFAPKYAGLVKSMITGNRHDLKPRLQELYTVSGMVHILSISGLQVSMLVGFCFLLCIRLRITREKSALIIVLFLPFYVLFTGAEAPVVRAALMAGLALIAVILNRTHETTSFFALAFIIQILWNPYQLWEAGFQLSFLMTWVLMIMGQSFINHENEFKMRNMFILAIVAQLASLPILTVSFYQSSLFSWISNLLFVPLLTFLLYPAALFSLLLGFLWNMAGVKVAQLISSCLDIIHQVVYNLKPLFFWQSSWSPPSLIWIIIYSLSLILGWLIFTSQHTRIKALHRWGIVIWVGLLLVYAHEFPSGFNRETRLTFLDVGQGDCLVIETKEGRVILVDGGGIPTFGQKKWQKKRKPFDVGAEVVVPYLRYRGIQKVDDIILTHGDFDHFGGLQKVGENFPVGRVIRNGHFPHSPEEKKLLDLWKQKGIPIYQAYQGVKEDLEQGITWEFLHPQQKGSAKGEKEPNHDSLVNILSIYGWQVLLTGDIDKEAEKQIVNTKRALAVDILKVAHHGSRTSTSELWLQHVKPRHAVISVGRNNRYGHPATQVIHRLQQSDAQIWRTDQHGAIIFTFSSEGYQIETVLP